MKLGRIFMINMNDVRHSSDAKNEMNGLHFPEIPLSIGLDASVGTAIRAETTEFRVKCGRWSHVWRCWWRFSTRRTRSTQVRIRNKSLNGTKKDCPPASLPEWLTGYYYCINTHLTGIAFGDCWTSTSELIRGPIVANIPSENMNMRKLDINIERVV